MLIWAAGACWLMWGGSDGGGGNDGGMAVCYSVGEEERSMLYEYNLRTGREGFIDITESVRDSIRQSGLVSGICVIHCPHTTAGITINENADPDVLHDLNIGMSEAFPDRREFRHGEGNSSAHLKSSSVGPSLTVIVDGGKPILGIWQGIYFCEFDGPRTRKYFIKTVADANQ